MNSSNNNIQSTAALTGRILIGILFVLSGLSKVLAPAGTIAFIGSTGLPAPMLGYIAAVVVELGGGLLLIAGFRVRPVASALAIFTMLAAFLFHNNLADQNTFIHFMKNVAITGGLLQVLAFGAGSFSLDRKFSRQPAQVAV